MACPNPFDAFRLATESLSDDIYLQASWRDVWTNLVPRETYKQGTGLVQSTFTVGRSEPTTDEPDFDLITLSQDSVYTGSCNTTYNEVPVGFTEKTYSPEQFGWKGPVICQDDLIFNFNAERFLQVYIPSITKNTLRTIGHRLAAIYAHFVPKYVVNETPDEAAGGTGDPPQSPVLTLDRSECMLTQDHLDHIAAQLNEDGASDPNSNGWISLGDEGPIYPLYVGQETSKQIQLNNSELRQDYRWAEPMALIKRMGASRVIGSFRHIINLFPPRYTYDGGAYTRVPTFIMSSTTKGQIADVNPAWRNAGHEGAYVLSPWVFHSEIVRPVNSAAGLNWMPKSYMGEWDFITGGREISEDDCFDPRKKLGRHFAEYKHAPRPIFPNFGRLIIFRRCDDDFTCVSCS